MTIQRFHQATRYSEIAVHNGVAYLAGQIPENTPNQPIYQQTKDVLDLIDKLLAEVNSDKSQILMAQIFLADMQDYAEMNRAWDEWVANNNAPPRACVEAKLADHSWKVEIVVTAATH
ncbi:MULTISPECIES: RidA family protein [unclassified Lonepinella]|uniref:RidA family protein n=1 Tax=unclassified Lonepinella TaxID=2642006 RepID=UPI0036D8409E